MSARRTFATVLALAGLTHCKSTPPAAAPPPVAPVVRLDAGVFDSAPAIVDAGPVDAPVPAVITIRVVNAGPQPLSVFTNEDSNEVIHVRHLWPRRILDASAAMAEGELVKFFPVGQMPLCSADGGAGYGGLGQPGRRILAPGEAMEFPWDGQLRREIVQPTRGVCMQIGVPDPGRYRFEFDQPYNLPTCNRPIVVFPQGVDARSIVEIRCVARPLRPGEDRH